MKEKRKREREREFFPKHLENCRTQLGLQIIKRVNYSMIMKII